MNYEIVIPTHNHCDDFLIPCMVNIYQYTRLGLNQPLVVANGCTDNTKQWLIDSGARFLWFDKPLGYAKSVNIGFKSTAAEYIILLDNDTHLLPQLPETWIERLLTPFQNEKVGCTSPFTNFYPGLGFVCHAGCTAYRRSALEKVGFCDDVEFPFPGILADADLSLRLQKAGYSCIDVSGGKIYRDGVFAINFPVVHMTGGNTFDRFGKDEPTVRKCWNFLYERHMKKISIIIPTHNHCIDFLKPCIDSILAYTDLGNIEIIITANGCQDGTKEYVKTLPNSVKVLWYNEPLGYTKATNLGIKVAVGEYIILLNNDTILLEQKKNEWLYLLLNPFLLDKEVGITGPMKFWWRCGKTRRTSMAFWLVMIKREVFDEVGLLDEIFSPGMGEDGDFCIRIQMAGYKLIQVPNDKTIEFGLGASDSSFPIYHQGAGSLGNEEGIRTRNDQILNDRYGEPKISIIIPHYKNLDELLKPCVESIFKYTNMENIELIVVANGSDERTRKYLDDYDLNYLWFDEPMGFTKAVNAGIQVSNGEYIIVLNNDTVLLEQLVNTWVDMLFVPFTDGKVGITGPLILHDRYSDKDVVIFFCVCIKRDVIDKIGLLDEIFSPGGGEDVDFAARAQDVGYKLAMVPPGKLEFLSTNVGGFPIWHKDNQTFKDIPTYPTEIVKRNGLINAFRHNKNIKLNLGSGGVEIEGFLSIDLCDVRAHIMADMTKLDFPDNSISELISSHSIEHINPYKLLETLQNWRRILKPGGKLTMELPNIEGICKKYIDADKGTKYELLNCVYGAVNTTDAGGVDEITSPHLFGYDPELITDHLLWAGFENITFGPERFWHQGVNMHVEATKPWN